MHAESKIERLTSIANFPFFNRFGLYKNRDMIGD